MLQPKVREPEHDTKQFISRHFYVDAGYTSTATPEEAVDVLTNSQKMLAQENLKLHKIPSNNQSHGSFSSKWKSKGPRSQTRWAATTMQFRSALELTDLCSRCPQKKDNTHRGVCQVCCTYNNAGKNPSVRTVNRTVIGMNHFLLKEKRNGTGEISWQIWKTNKDQGALAVLQPSVQKQELCIFSDASTLAVEAVAYLKAVTSEGQCHTGFIIGKSKIAPHHGGRVVEMYKLIRDGHQIWSTLSATYITLTKLF